MTGPSGAGFDELEDVICAAWCVETRSRRRGDVHFWGGQDVQESARGTEGRNAATMSRMLANRRLLQDETTVVREREATKKDVD